MSEEYAWRKEKAEVLKAKFNSLWDEALESGNGVLSYRDMVRIVDVMRFDAPHLLDGKPLPTIIDAGLELAIAMVNPNKVSQREGLKKVFSLAVGAGGVGVIASFLIPMLYPVFGASIVTFFAGGIAGGLTGPLGIIGGSFISLGALLKYLQKMTPEQRAVKCHTVVQEAINKWVKESEIKAKGLPFFRKRELK